MVTRIFARDQRAGEQRGAVGQHSLGNESGRGLPEGPWGIVERSRPELQAAVVPVGPKPGAEGVQLRLCRVFQPAHVTFNVRGSCVGDKGRGCFCMDGHLFGQIGAEHVVNEDEVAEKLEPAIVQHVAGWVSG